ncbi:SGNH/GDSL hydrolase family protein [Actinophytocola sp.]|uniref:SGNH/GDSL hydrolase family protein n=1 Tax=Actinophytocola sp. TaxID=1872138 RepID=UPI002D6E349C|nr:SGNH/GDSL hydrolase family protein [Actinophytocola sp.]HYQ62004.1 SGNH/GDSL hydrolase family protein [Actinophytocola sp.]
MRLPRLAPLAVAVALATALLPSFATVAPAATAVAAGEPAGAAQLAPADPSTVDPVVRDRVLPAGWQSSHDLAWTTDGDSTGFHLLVADASSGYTWRTAATLAEPWLETDRWIGNACLTESGTKAVVVYAPRHFTNRPYLFDRGAFVAVVDLTSGAVSKLDVTVSLAYYDPGCGAGETAVLTQSGAVDLGRTRLHVVDTAKAAVVRSLELDGEVTSAVPAGGGVLAARGGQIIRVGDDGKATPVADTRGTAIRLHPDSAGGIVYLERDGDTSVVRRLAGGQAHELGRGPLTEVNLVAGTGRRVFVTGRPAMAKALPAAVTRVPVAADAEVSTDGGVTLTRTDQARNLALVATPERTISLRATVRATEKSVDFVVTPSARLSPRAAEGTRPAPVEPDAAPRTESPTNPVDQDRACSVPRNDARIQVYQPHWSQVEWAAEQAVQGGLSIQRPVNWKQSGMPVAWRPQLMFEPVGLAGGGRVPAQILLGVLAQESNLWQASFHVAEGVTGNPLVGSFYGVEDGWGINWAGGDCGYGVAQVTDGMRRTGTGLLPPEQQLAVAVDYATNIAAGLRILQQKWNQTRALGMTVNGGDASRMESWFAALWAYNSGINPQASTGNTTGCSPGPNCTDAAGNGPGGNYGLGWSNNPARPDYPFNRTPFLDNDNYDDARHPQHWPYPEKVIGWAAYPIVKYTGGEGYEGGYKQAWWTSNDFRTSAKPPVGKFCDPSPTTGNLCNPNNIGTASNPCLRTSDFHCWWHSPASWKDCSPNSNTCGYEAANLSTPGSAEPPDADLAGAYVDESRNRYRPRCHLNGLPTGSLVIDDVGDSVPSVRPDCARTWTNQGSFGLRFAQHTDGLYHSKVDFHQIGGGFGGHFWFTHTRTVPANQAKSWEVTGTWTLNRSLNQWARVLVAMPDHGAHTQQGTYTINLGNGQTRRRSIQQKTQEHRWVSLGAFNFAGTPSVTLSSITGEGDGTQDIAFDAVAFAPLPGKPDEQLVVLGDSYASGDGAGNYFPETDDSGTGGSAWRNGCHRSRNAWSRQAVLPGTTETVGARADRFDPTMDYHLLACSGAKTVNLLPNQGFGGHGQHKELSQLDRGFLDDATTTVALSIGGNDAHFSDVITLCTAGTPTPLQDCRDSAAPTDWYGDPPQVTAPLKVALPAIIDDQVKPAIETVLRQVRAAAPNARIVVMGYPRLFPLMGDGGTWYRKQVCKTTLGLIDGEMDFLNDMNDLLNDALHESVVKLRDERVPVSYSDPREEFELSQICSSDEANNESIHRVVVSKTEGEDPSGLVSQQSFHPKQAGAGRYAAAFVTTLGAVRDGVGPVAPPSTQVAKAELFDLQFYPPPQNPPAYDRKKFNPTTSRDWAFYAGANCTTREIVLRRDRTRVVPASGCPVTEGEWANPYATGADAVITVPPTPMKDVPIDHMVALKDAWRNGASGWTDQRRIMFANDLEHPQLLVVSNSSNGSKQDQPPDVWLPTPSYWCTYARSWIHVKRVYHLAVTSSEYHSLLDIVNHC